MRAALAQSDMDLPDAPARWGDMREHIFYGALYHWFVMTGGWDYPAFRPHRALTVREEFRLYLKRLALLPFHSVQRWFASKAIRNGGFPYHLVLLQLEPSDPGASGGVFLSLARRKVLPPAEPYVVKIHAVQGGKLVTTQLELPLSGDRLEIDWKAGAFGPPRPEPTKPPPAPVAARP